MEAMTFEMAQKIHKFYLCSHCWGKLGLPVPTDDGGFVVFCERCGEETKGYISQRRAEQMKSDSISQERDVLRLLRKLGLIPDPLAGLSQQDKIKQLGF